MLGIENHFRPRRSILPSLQTSQQQLSPPEHTATHLKAFIFLFLESFFRTVFLVFLSAHALGLDIAYYSVSKRHIGGLVCLNSPYDAWHLSSLPSSNHCAS